MRTTRTPCRYFKKAIELDPDLTTAEIYLATAYAQQFIPGGRGEDNEKNAELGDPDIRRRAETRSEQCQRRSPGLASIYQNTQPIFRRPTSTT